jgi:hypothetical protein
MDARPWPESEGGMRLDELAEAVDGPDYSRANLASTARAVRGLAHRGEVTIRRQSLGRRPVPNTEIHYANGTVRPLTMPTRPVSFIFRPEEKGGHQ